MNREHYRTSIDVKADTPTKNTKKTSQGTEEKSETKLATRTRRASILAEDEVKKQEPSTPTRRGRKPSVTDSAEEEKPKSVRSRRNSAADQATDSEQKPKSNRGRRKSVDANIENVATPKMTSKTSSTTRRKKNSESDEQTEGVKPTSRRRQSVTEEETAKEPQKSAPRRGRRASIEKVDNSGNDKLNDAINAKKASPVFEKDLSIKITPLKKVRILDKVEADLDLSIINESSDDSKLETSKNNFMDNDVETKKDSNESENTITQQVTPKSNQKNSPKLVQKQSNDSSQNKPLTIAKCDESYLLNISNESTGSNKENIDFKISKKKNLVVLTEMDPKHLHIHSIESKSVACIQTNPIKENKSQIVNETIGNEDDNNEYIIKETGTAVDISINLDKNIRTSNKRVETDSQIAIKLDGKTKITNSPKEKNVASISKKSVIEPSKSEKKRSETGTSPSLNVLETSIDENVEKVTVNPTKNNEAINDSTSLIKESDQSSNLTIINDSKTLDNSEIIMDTCSTCEAPIVVTQSENENFIGTDDEEKLLESPNSKSVPEDNSVNKVKLDTNSKDNVDKLDEIKSSDTTHLEDKKDYQSKNVEKLELPPIRTENKSEDVKKAENVTDVAQKISSSPEKISNSANILDVNKKSEENLMNDEVSGKSLTGNTSEIELKESELTSYDFSIPSEDEDLVESDRVLSNEQEANKSHDVKKILSPQIKNQVATFGLAPPLKVVIEEQNITSNVPEEISENKSNTSKQTPDLKKSSPQKSREKNDAENIEPIKENISLSMNEEGIKQISEDKEGLPKENIEMDFESPHRYEQSQSLKRPSPQSLSAEEGESKIVLKRRKILQNEEENLPGQISDLINTSPQKKTKTVTEKITTPKDGLDISMSKTDNCSNPEYIKLIKTKSTESDGISEELPNGTSNSSDKYTEKIELSQSSETEVPVKDNQEHVSDNSLKSAEQLFGNSVKSISEINSPDKNEVCIMESLQISENSKNNVGETEFDSLKDPQLPVVESEQPQSSGKGVVETELNKVFVMEDEQVPVNLERNIETTIESSGKNEVCIMESLQISENSKNNVGETEFDSLKDPQLAVVESEQPQSSGKGLVETELNKVFVMEDEQVPVKLERNVETTIESSGKNEESVLENQQEQLSENFAANLDIEFESSSKNEMSVTDNQQEQLSVSSEKKSKETKIEPSSKNKESVSEKQQVQVSDNSEDVADSFASSNKNEPFIIKNRQEQTSKNSETNALDTKIESSIKNQKCIVENQVQLPENSEEKTETEFESLTKSETSSIENRQEHISRNSETNATEKEIESFSQTEALIIKNGKDQISENSAKSTIVAEVEKQVQSSKNSEDIADSEFEPSSQNEPYIIDSKQEQVSGKNKTNDDENDIASSREAIKQGMKTDFEISLENVSSKEISFADPDEHSDTSIDCDTEVRGKSEKSKNGNFSLSEINTRLDDFITSNLNEINESSSEESENDEKCVFYNDFFDDIAEEGEEDTPSEDSNQIIDEGEYIGSTDNDEQESDDEYENDSFICDDDCQELLSGEEYDLDNEPKTERQKKKKRIIDASELPDDEIINVSKPKKTVVKKKSRIIKVSTSSSDEENLRESLSVDILDEELVLNQDKEESVIVLDTPNTDIDEVSHAENKEESKTIVLDQSSSLEEGSSSQIKKEKCIENKPRKSLLTIQENILVDGPKDLTIRKRINSLVDSFCSNVSNGEVALNISLEFDNQKISEDKKQVFVNGSSDSFDSSDSREVLDSEEELSVSMGKVKDLSEVLNKKSMKRRLSSSVDDTNILQSKKRKIKKTANTKKGSSQTSLKPLSGFGLIDQLITDVKNRPRRVIKPSQSIDFVSSWTTTKVENVKPSTSPKKVQLISNKKIHPKDFKNQMFSDNTRIRRITTKTLLRKKGVFS